MIGLFRRNIVFQPFIGLGPDAPDASWQRIDHAGRLILPGFYDFRGYRAMYRDFLRAIREGRTPEMSLERAIEDQLLMDQVYASLERTGQLGQ